MPKICPSCGCVEKEGEFAGSFCPSCASHAFSPRLPHSLEVCICAKCSRARVSGEWTFFGEKERKAWLEKQLKLPSGASLSAAAFSKAKGGFRADLVIAVSSSGKDFELHRDVFVRVDGNACDDCRKKSGGYHEAVVQFRGDFSKCVKLAQRFARNVARFSFIGAIDEKKEGVDLLVGSKSAALGTLSAMRQQFSVSRKLIGVNDGKRVYRITACVRVSKPVEE